ncbi:MAG: pilus assembly protein PilP [Bdellovibrionales bacterium]|nr:pilus assembly protein PilP [Bdellovibrionales bacterium]
MRVKTLNFLRDFIFLSGVSLFLHQNLLAQVHGNEITPKESIKVNETSAGQPGEPLPTPPLPQTSPPPSQTSPPPQLETHETKVDETPSAVSPPPSQPPNSKEMREGFAQPETAGDQIDKKSAKAAGKLSAELESFLEPYIYDPKVGRDPFKAFVEVRPLEEGEMAGPLLPLQQYDVNQLKLVGIIWNVNDPKAMFVDPKNQVHIVRRDERLGRRNGYVAVIREGEVVVVEALKVKGDLMYSTRVLKMKSNQKQSAN